MFGVARLPTPAPTLRGLAEGRVTAWQYAAASDTVEYVRTGGRAHAEGSPPRSGVPGK